MFRIDQSCYFTDYLHKKYNWVSAEKRKNNCKMTIILFQFDSLQIFLYAFINFMRNLDLENYLLHFQAKKGTIWKQARGGFQKAIFIWLPRYKIISWGILWISAT